MRARLLSPPVLVAALLLTTLIPSASNCSTPASGSIGFAAPSTTWTGPDVSAQTAGPESCGDQTEQLPPLCDDFSLAVTDAGQLDVSVMGTVPANDFDLYVYDSAGILVASSAAAGGLEFATVPCATPAAGPYLVRAVYFTTVATPLADDPGYSGDASWSAASGRPPS
jgi:alpha-glucosidase